MDALFILINSVRLIIFIDGPLRLFLIRGTVPNEKEVFNFQY